MNLSDNWDVCKWVWEYFVETEAKTMVECKHCHLYLQCTRTSDLYRHFMDHHWHDLRNNCDVDSYTRMSSDPLWVMNEFNKRCITHVVLCKICHVPITCRHPITLADHLYDHKIDNQSDPTKEIGQSEPQPSSTVEIPRTCDDNYSLKKYLRAIKRDGQPLRCYENCKLHDGEDKLPFKVTVVRRLTSTHLKN
ncbi:uncharacterized protein LOC109856762 [Pseudomyrmex gracilis]|uniref:uncharacterized protein LOC109856762 n=1 Tax=Pseudomyrmex gracilis TaxID=219809 RepID=UPI00099544C6|nr:uncharacterized protein LOC109856762 [Pseudomyrmex gracilis]